MRVFPLAARLGALLSVLAIATGAAGQPARPDPQDFSQIAHGRYVAVLGDCAACHTNQGGSPYAGGRVIATPFGNVLASNITPDGATGIGAWTDGQFIRAMTDGIAPGGRRLYPAMPYPYYARMTTGDLIALKAYLNTLTPVHNRVRSDQLPFPFDLRFGMVFWNWLFYMPGTFKPDARNSPRGTAAPISSKAPAIAPPATRRRTSSAATGAANSSAATRSKVGSRRTSPTTTMSASARGRSRTSSPISRPA